MSWKLLLAFYLIGFTPTVTVAAGGGPSIRPNWIMVLNPRSGMAIVPASSNSPSRERTAFSASTNSISGPSTETPNCTEPAGCIVSILFSMVIPAFSRPSMSCIANIKPSVSLEYDLMPIRRSANEVSEAKPSCCRSVNRRGWIAASNSKLEARNSAASLSNLAISRLEYSSFILPIQTMRLVVGIGAIYVDQKHVACRDCKIKKFQIRTLPFPASVGQAGAEEKGNCQLNGAPALTIFAKGRKEIGWRR